MKRESSASIHSTRLSTPSIKKNHFLQSLDNLTLTDSMAASHSSSLSWLHDGPNWKWLSLDWITTVINQSTWGALPPSGRETLLRCSTTITLGRRQPSAAANSAAWRTLQLSYSFDNSSLLYSSVYRTLSTIGFNAIGFVPLKTPSDVTSNFAL